MEDDVRSIVDKAVKELGTEKASFIYIFLLGAYDDHFSARISSLLALITRCRQNHTVAIVLLILVFVFSTGLLCHCLILLDLVLLFF